MDFAKPYYTAAVNTCGSGFDVRINDCPVASHRKRAITTVVPANEWIHDGPNHLSIELQPLPRETVVRPGATASVELRVRDDDDSTQHSVCELSYQNGRMLLRRPDEPPGEGTPIQVTARPDGSLFVLQPILLRVPFGPWRWRSAPIFGDTPAIRQSLMNEVDQLHLLFAQGDLDAVAELGRERNLEWATAYYGTYEDALNATRNTFEMICLEPAFSLQPTTKTRVKLHQYAHGRLAYLTNHLDESTLFYANSDITLIGQLKFVFRLDENRHWIICR